LTGARQTHPPDGVPLPAVTANAKVTLGVEQLTELQLDLLVRRVGRKTSRGNPMRSWLGRVRPQKLAKGDHYTGKLALGP
jgi:hypothetical protein